MVTKFDQQRSKFLEKLYEGSEWTDEDILSLFRFQFEYNPVYKHFCTALHKIPSHVHAIKDIPFIPVSAFKFHDVKTGDWKASQTFLSSGTTGQVRSAHHVRDINVYHHCCKTSFERIYGDPGRYTWLALLPSYIEAGNSSLVDMVSYFMSLSSRDHGFFLHDFYELDQRIKAADSNNESVVMIGVSYALLDFSARYPQELPSGSIVMETGGMKGRRTELSRAQLHHELQKGFLVDNVHSEYGMTEMMHQMYAPGKGIFSSRTGAIPVVRELNDPLALNFRGGSGLLNILDLGNIDSCSFIATDDLAIIHNDDGGLEVIGRSDNSEARGCNLLYTSTGKQVND